MVENEEIKSVIYINLDILKFYYKIKWLCIIFLKFLIFCISYFYLVQIIIILIIISTIIIKTFFGQMCLSAYLNKHIKLVVFFFLSQSSEREKNNIIIFFPPNHSALPLDSTSAHIA